MAGRETASPAGAQAPSDFAQVLRAVRPPLVAILMLLMFGTFYMARELLLPIVLAFVLAITLSPVVRALSRRAIPAPVTALAIVATLIASLASGAYLLSEPVAKWIEMAPSIGAELKAKLYHLREPVAAVVQAREQVEDIASAVSTQISDTRQIAVEGPGLLSLAANGAISTVTTFSLSLVLLLFLLMSGDMFYEKLVRVAPTFADKRKTLTIVYDVERRVSRYLFSITLINVALGVCVGALLHLAGMPNPVLWGVLATALNYIPYIGPAVGIVLVAIVAAVTFDTLTAMAVPPGLYLLANIVESQLVTPLVVGRSLELNAVAVFIALVFWTWIWGVPGTLLAIPILVITKVFCDNLPGMSGFGEFLSARSPQVHEDSREDSREGA